MLPQLTLVLGGAASGKSAFAERLSSLPRMPQTYIATADVGDGEMAAKIALHQARRGPDWDCVEAPTDLAAALARVGPGRVVLVDCATMWLSNLMALGGDLAAEEARMMAALKTCAAPVIIVSNELGQGIVPENALARAFRQTHGELNQKLAARAGLVVSVMAGLPMVLKGETPEGLQ